jgi:hypothetical protein
VNTIDKARLLAVPMLVMVLATAGCTSTSGGGAKGGAGGGSGGRGGTGGAGASSVSAGGSGGSASGGTGGATGTGGAKVAGGASSASGGNGTGGVKGIGSTANSGGASGNSGVKGAGGATKTGGAVAAGGAIGTGGTSASGGATGACATGTATTITQVMNGSVAVGTNVTLTGVVATSPKFLASKGSTGDCLWGVFVSEPVAQAVPYSGALVVTLGTPATVDATGTYACPAGTDVIPTDTAAGDVFTVSANIKSYVKASCATSASPAPTPEVRVADACGLRRTATGQKVPAPAIVPDVTELTNAATEAIHRNWSGVLIKLDNVTAQGSVGSTGSIQLTNGVRVRDRIYQPKTAVFASRTAFVSITGISHLDVCTWSIEPRDPCTDYNPKSQNCP